MRKTIYVLILFLFPLSALATGQTGDIIIWGTDTLMLFSNPLESRPDISVLKRQILSDREPKLNTALWRGYVAEWTIIGKDLYLTNIYYDFYKDHGKVDLKELFKSEFKDGKIKATWFTGNLLIPKGECLFYVHDGYLSSYEKEIVLSFKNGIYKKKKEYDNSKSHKSIFTQKEDSLQNFLYSHINWKSIPDMKDGRVTIRFFIKSGKTNKPDIIKIWYKKGEKAFKKEATRVIRLLPDWDIYYKQGKASGMYWTIPIHFDEAHRKKYYFAATPVTQN